MIPRFSNLFLIFLQSSLVSLQSACTFLLFIFLSCSINEFECQNNFSWLNRSSYEGSIRLQELDYDHLALIQCNLGPHPNFEMVVKPKKNLEIRKFYHFSFLFHFFSLNHFVIDLCFLVFIFFFIVFNHHIIVITNIFRSFSSLWRSSNFGKALWSSLPCFENRKWRHIWRGVRTPDFHLSILRL